MSFGKVIVLLFALSLFAFVACNEDSGTTEPTSAAAQTAIETEMAAMDQMVTEIAGGPMLLAMMQFQAVSAEFFGDGFPLAPAIQQINTLNKYSGIGRFNEIKVDTGLVALFTVLELMQGTHTYSSEDTSWTHNNQPAGQVIFVYPFMGTSGEQEAKIAISNYNLENDNASLSLAVMIDGSNVMTMELSINGNNFVLPVTESAISSVAIEGSITGQSGITANYSVNITDANLVMTLGAAGVSGLSINAEGSSFMSTDLNGENDPTSNVEKLTIAIGANIEFIITDLNAESGKVGDVYYQGDDVGDLVAEGDQLFIEYEGGKKVAFETMMPNTFSFAGVIGG